MIVLFVIIAILVIIALLRLGAVVRYDEEGLYVSVFAGPVSITVVPRKKKETDGKKKQKKKRKEKKTGEPEEKEEKKKGGTVRKLLDIVSAVSEPLKRLRKRLLVNELTLRYCAAGGPDPAKAAMSYGYTNAAAGTFLGILERLFRIKKRSVSTSVDFTAEEPLVFAKLKLSLSVWEILYIAAGLDLKKLKNVLTDN